MELFSIRIQRTFQLVSTFKGYSLCIFIVFSCIGILTDCLLFLVIYSFMDICEHM